MTEINKRKWEFTGLTLDMFRCDLCQNLLIWPVKQAVATGTICYSCYDREHNNLQRARPVPKLDRIIYHMCLTCPNEGCTAKLTMFEFEEHKQLCLNMTTRCLDNSCRWSGKESDLAGHFVEEHTENVILSDCKGQFVVHVDATSTTVYLFCKENGDTYFCKIIGRNGRRPLQVTLYEASNSFNNTIHRDQAVVSVNTESEKNIMELIVDQLSNVHEEDEEDEEDLPRDSWVFSEEEMVELTVSIVPIKEQNDGKTVNELYYSHIRSLLECTVCKKTMRTSIFRCNGGHGFCESCTTKMSKCPICNDTLTNCKRNVQ